MLFGHLRQNPSASVSGRQSRRDWLKRACALLPSFWLGGGIAQASVREGTNSREARREALNSLPLDKLAGPAQGKIKSILSDYSLYRRLPLEVVPCDPELYLFLVNRPDTVVNIWEILGISDVKLRQTGTHTYRADDGRGTVTNVEFLHRSHDKHVIYADGTYQGPLFQRELRGSGLMYLRTGYIRDKIGQQLVVHQLDSFLRIDGTGAEVMARTLQRMFGKIADRNFSEISEFLGSLAQKAEADPAWIQQMADGMKAVHPQVRQDFVKVAFRVAARHAIQPTSAEKPSTAEAE